MTCRRPIQPWERAYLITLGNVLREQRLAAGLTQASLARRAQVSTGHLQRLEHGRRRTRLSTLSRLAAVLTSDPSSQQRLLGNLASSAGPALAPESDYDDRITRRRKTRFGRRQNRPSPRRMAA